MGKILAGLFSANIKALLLGGVEAEIGHLVSTVKPERLGGETKHYLKGRFGIDPAIKHPNPILGFFHLGTPAEKAAACAKIDAEVDSIVAHNPPDKLAGAIVALVEGEVAHLFH